MATRRLRALARHLATRDADSQLAVVPAAKATAVVAAVDQNEAPAEMSDTEKFLWDLQGFLTVKAFLTPGEVDALNDAFDANWDKRNDCHQTPAYDEFGGMLTWEHPHCQPFRDLLAHRKIIPYMNTFFGRGWKLDHHPFMITGDMNTKKGKARPQGEGNFHVGGGGTMHGSTARHFNGSQYYTYANGQMRNGMIVAAFQLRAINEGDGGFGLIPGSHKANYAMPVEIATSSRVHPIKPIYNVPAEAGDLIFFSEATIHGTLPWTNPNTERRSLMYRYMPKYLHFAGGTFQTTQPEWVSELTPAQQAVLEPPYIYNRPLVANDGVSVLQPRVG